MADSKDWIVRYYASHDDIPEGHHDGEIVRELIRCKDCKYNTTDKKCLYPDSIIKIPDDNDYCSYGERKTE